jgi:outer membrane protein TolC
MTLLLGLPAPGRLSAAQPWTRSPAEAAVEEAVASHDVQEVPAIPLVEAETEAEVEPVSKRSTSAERPVRNLGLEECRRLALSHNLDLRAQLVTPAVAAEQVRAEQAKFESVFYTNLSTVFTDTPTSSALDGSQVYQFRGEAGVQIPLTTGGTLTLSLADRRTKTDNVFSLLDPAYEVDAGVRLSQPLLRGAGWATNRYTIRVAQLDRAVADTRTRLEVTRVLANVDRLYWRLYAARRDLDVGLRQYELAEAQAEQAQRFVEAGRRTDIEVLRAEAAMAQRLQAIILADAAVRQRERDLKRVLNAPGLPVAGSVGVVPESDPVPVWYGLDRDRLLHVARKERMELLEYEYQALKQAMTVEYMRNQALPLVTLDYSYNLNGLGAARGDAYDVLARHDFEDHYVGLSVVVPLGNRGAASRLRQACLQRLQLLHTRESRERLVEVEVLNALDQVTANWQRILAAEQSVTLHQRLVDAQKRQFEVGLGTGTDVLGTQTALADAERTQLSALVDYQISLVDLAYATGTLLGAGGVEWQPVEDLE